MAGRPVGLSEAARVALASPARLEILLLCEAKAWTAAQLAERLGGKRQTMLYHLRELEQAGLVREIGRVPISGGPLISYGATAVGWAQLIADANLLADRGADATGA